MQEIYKTFEDKPSLYYSESECCADKNDFCQLILPAELSLMCIVYRMLKSYNFSRYSEMIQNHWRLVTSSIFLDAKEADK